MNHEEAYVMLIKYGKTDKEARSIVDDTDNMSLWLRDSYIRRVLGIL